VNHTTETIATLDTSLAPLRRRYHRRTCRPGRREGQRSMWPVAVIVGYELCERPAQVGFPEDDDPIQAFLLD
jgi:hypothetical protein